MRYELQVNGQTHELNVPRNTSLLNVLRDDLGLTGTRYGAHQQEPADASATMCALN
jgi:aerobic-type carbon monoxide dehydrogenase small subunit (CoxS/CutS family)